MKLYIDEKPLPVCPGFAVRLSACPGPAALVGPLEGVLRGAAVTDGFSDGPGGAAYGSRPVEVAVEVVSAVSLSDEGAPAGGVPEKAPAGFSLPGILSPASLPASSALAANPSLNYAETDGLQAGCRTTSSGGVPGALVKPPFANACLHLPDEAPGFSSRPHRGRLEAGGAPVAEGPLRLESCKLVAGKPAGYRFALDCGGHPWAAHAARNPLRTLAVEWSARLSAADIEASWTGDGPVVFLPVERHSLPADPLRALTAEDYHPFVRVRAVVERIFSEAGYLLESRFMASEPLRSLLVSGRYPQRDVEALQRAMDFRAARSADGRAAAADDGTVAADPRAHYNTVGNLVDTADPTASDAPDGVFDPGGRFRLVDGRAAFVPSRRATASFEYDLRYETSYRIATREALEGFDRFVLSAGDERRVRIPNRFADMRSGWRKGVSYRALVFIARTSGQYEVTAAVGGAVASFTGRSAVFTMPESAEGALRLRYRATPTDAWTDCADDWALYYGYVAESGAVEAHFVVRSAPVELRPGEPHYFDGFVFAGARPGDGITVRRGTSVRPVFSPHPGEGSAVTFSSVFSYADSRLKFLKALAQMFDLRFLTDRVRGRVIVEPACDFYLSEPVVDMTGRELPDGEVRVEEPAPGLPCGVRLCYRPSSGGGSSEKYSDGGWSAAIDSSPAVEGELRIENPMFCAAESVAGAFPDAASARLLRVGSAPAGEPIPDDLNFEPIAVRWLGMAALPAGQRWGWPSYGAQYPSAAFSDEGRPASGPVPAVDAFTLAFADSAASAGLRTYWEGTLARVNRSRRVRMRLRLRPEEFAWIVRPDSAMRGFRALWRLDVGGERGLYRLLEVASYDPRACAADCVFVKDVRTPAGRRG